MSLNEVQLPMVIYYRHLYENKNKSIISYLLKGFEQNIRILSPLLHFFLKNDRAKLGMISERIQTFCILEKFHVCKVKTNIAGL